MYQHLSPSKSVPIATTIFEINHRTTYILKICSDVASSFKSCNKMSLTASLVRDKSNVIISEYELLSSHDTVMLMRDSYF